MDGIRCPQCGNRGNVHNTANWPNGTDYLVERHECATCRVEWERTYKYVSSSLTINLAPEEGEQADGNYIHGGERYVKEVDDA